MAQVTTPTGDVFEEESLRALEYYQREPGYTVGAAVPDEAVELVDGNVQDVLRAVGDDPEKAAQALAAEQAREGGPRVTLVDKLTAIAATSEPVE